MRPPFRAQTAHHLRALLRPPPAARRPPHFRARQRGGMDSAPFPHYALLRPAAPPPFPFAGSPCFYAPQTGCTLFWVRGGGSPFPLAGAPVCLRAPPHPPFARTPGTHKRQFTEGPSFRSWAVPGRQCAPSPFTCTTSPCPAPPIFLVYAHRRVGTTPPTPQPPHFVCAPSDSAHATPPPAIKPET